MTSIHGQEEVKLLLHSQVVLLYRSSILSMSGYHTQCMIDSDLGGWEFCKREQQSTKMSDSEVDGNFDEAEITVEDLMSISDKVVDQIIMLIGDTTSIFEGGGEGNDGRWGFLWKSLLDEKITRRICWHCEGDCESA